MEHQRGIKQVKMVNIKHRQNTNKVLSRYQRT